MNKNAERILSQARTNGVVISSAQKTQYFKNVQKIFWESNRRDADFSTFHKSSSELCNEHFSNGAKFQYSVSSPISLIYITKVVGRI